MDLLPTVVVLPPTESDAYGKDFRIVVTAVDGRTVTVLVPVPEGRDNWVWDACDTYGLNLVTDGHYG